MRQKLGVRYSFFIDRMIVVIAYCAAIVAAWLTVVLMEGNPLWLKIAVADFVGTVVIFISSVIVRNSSMYDPYWSVAPLVILGYLLILNGFPIDNARVWLLTIVVVYWGIRLTWNWLKTWPGLEHEDWRYRKLAEDTGVFYWPVSFLGIHLFPTILVYMGCLPMIPVIDSSSTFVWTDLLGFAISFTAVEIERRSDNQLRAFKSQATGNEVCRVGLWKYSRHPNYFGEIMFWCGLFVMAYGLDLSENLYFGIGFLSMVILFVFISIPMMEKRQVKKTGYAQYRSQVSMLIPWKPGKNR